MKNKNLLFGISSLFASFSFFEEKRLVFLETSTEEEIDSETEETEEEGSKELTSDQIEQMDKDDETAQDKIRKEEGEARKKDLKEAERIFGRLTGGKYSMTEDEGIAEMHRRKKEAKERGEIKEEAKSNGVSDKQVDDLISMALVKCRKDLDWVKETFSFPGNGVIEMKEDLDYSNSSSSARIPEKLEIKGDLDISDWKYPEPTSLPDKITVRGTLTMDKIPLLNIRERLAWRSKIKGWTIDGGIKKI
ncbi:MAG TPA: hypothetical protein ENI70_00465 [Candidatus Peregrinibacteria bacterium]|nr:hypothetical protein [Candidatus Peregrinibacteria bacterium]